MDEIFLFYIHIGNFYMIQIKPSAYVMMICIIIIPCLKHRIFAYCIFYLYCIPFCCIHIMYVFWFVSLRCTYISRGSCQKGPTCHACAWQIGPFWQDTLDMYVFHSTHHCTHTFMYVLKTVCSVYILCSAHQLWCHDMDRPCHYWTSVRETHGSPVYYHHKGAVIIGSFNMFIVVILHILFCKQLNVCHLRCKIHLCWNFMNIM